MQNITASSDQHVSRLAVSWVLIIPLMFFALAGTLRLDLYNHNNAFEASYTTMAGGDGPERIMQKVIMLICTVLVCTKLREVVDVAINNKILVALAMFAVASTMWSQFPTETLPRAIYLTVNVFFTFYLATRFPPRRQMQLFLTLGWVVVLSCIVAAVVFPQYGTDHQQEGAFGAWIGIFSHKNWCSIMVAFLLSGAFYLRPSSSASRFSRNAFITLSLLVIGMSQSRTGWFVTLCLLLYVGATKYLKRYKSQDLLFIVLCSAGAAMVAGVLLVQNYTALMLFLGKDPTLTGRTKIWTLVLQAISKRPLLGYGYRAFWHGLQGESANLSLADQWIIPAAHDGFLDLWLGLGAIGVGMVVYSMLQAVRNGITCFRGGSSPSAEWYMSIIVLTLAANIAELTLMVPDDLAWIIYILACVGLSLEAKRIRSGLVYE